MANVTVVNIDKKYSVSLSIYVAKDALLMRRHCVLPSGALISVNTPVHLYYVTRRHANIISPEDGAILRITTAQWPQHVTMAMTRLDNRD